MLDQDSDEKLRAEHPVVQAKDGERLISQINAENSNPANSSLDTLVECQYSDPELNC